MLDHVDDTSEMELEIVPYPEAKPMLEKHAGFRGSLRHKPPTPRRNNDGTGHRQPHFGHHC